MSKRKATHTPTPWRVEWNPTERGEPATLIMQAHAEMWEKWIASCPWGTDGDTDGKDGDGRRDCSVAEAQANAELIVRAVNSHHDLLTNCKDMLDYIRTYGPKKYPREYEKWESAIAAAEGGTPS